MQWGSVVWFPDHPRPFLVRDEYCGNPECDCNEVVLTLQEISDCGIAVSQPIVLALRVDLVTWKEWNPPERSLQSAAWVRQFLSQFPADRRAEMKAISDKKKQTVRRIAKYTIDPVQVTDGILFPYSDLHSDKSALTSGGRHYSYSLFHQNKEYMVEDLYCPKPTCDCREFYLQFWVSRDDIKQVTISQLFLGKVKFTGQQAVIARQKIPLAEAEAMLSAWWDRYHDDLPMLQDRYKKVKEIGQRSLDAAKESRVIPPLLVTHRAPLLRTSEDSGLLPDELLPNPIRVGRNDFCPCGSGRKYKKCCGQ